MILKNLVIVDNTGPGQKANLDDSHNIHTVNDGIKADPSWAESESQKEKACLMKKKVS